MSVTRGPSPSYVSDDDTVERNRYLELRLKYVQGVNGVYRHRVRVLVESLVQQLVDLHAYRDGPAAAEHAKKELLLRLAEATSDTAVETCAPAASELVAAAAPAPSDPALQQRMVQLEAQNKALTHRVSALRLQLERSAVVCAASTEATATPAIEVMSAANRELRARLITAEAEKRRLQSDIEGLQSDKRLQEQRLVRMQGQCAAVEREAACAVSEGLAAAQLNETSLLRRQLDTMELVLRRTEIEAASYRQQLDAREAAFAQRDRDVAALQSRIAVLETSIAAYKSRCDAAVVTANEHREAQLHSVSTLGENVSTAVAELHEAYSTKILTAELKTLRVNTDKLRSLQLTLDHVSEQLSIRTEQRDALRDEIAACILQDRQPTKDAVTNAMARAMMFQEAEGCGPRDTVLRTRGEWKEVRDNNSKKIFYVTTNARGTAFDPRYAMEGVDAATQANGDAFDPDAPPSPTARRARSATTVAPARVALPTMPAWVASESPPASSSAAPSPDMPAQIPSEDLDARGHAGVEQAAELPTAEATTPPALPVFPSMAHTPPLTASTLPSAAPRSPPAAAVQPTRSSPAPVPADHTAAAAAPAVPPAASTAPPRITRVTAGAPGESSPTPSLPSGTVFSPIPASLWSAPVLPTTADDATAADPEKKKKKKAVVINDTPEVATE